MATTNYEGKGASVDDAREALFKNAGTRDVTGVEYSVTVGYGTPAGGVTGKKHRNYETAFTSALKAAGIIEYNPGTQALEVTASGTVKVPGRASGAGPAHSTSVDITDKF